LRRAGNAEERGITAPYPPLLRVRRRLGRVKRFFGRAFKGGAG
jgi:hypothetical protein